MEGFLLMYQKMLISSLICEGSFITQGRIAHFVIGIMPMCRWGSFIVLLFYLMANMFCTFCYVGFKSILLTLLSHFIILLYDD